jgi:hypothetical protein
MAENFGLINLIVSPVLERVVREERLAGDQHRKPKLLKPRTAKKEPDSSPFEDTQQTDDSASSKHIDLRI